MQAEFDQIVASFDRSEALRAEIYDRAMRMSAGGFAIEAHLLILSTWNYARFRYVMGTFDLAGYEATVERLIRRFEVLGEAELMSSDLAPRRDLIVESFEELARIPGVEFTGASKILHLLKPKFFVMWDRYITGNSQPWRDYATLEVVRAGLWEPRWFALSGGGYYDFLNDCKTRFRDLVNPSPNRTMAKRIDEFNYCTITEPLMELRARRKAAKGTKA